MPAPGILVVLGVYGLILLVTAVVWVVAFKARGVSLCTRPPAGAEGEFEAVRAPRYHGKYASDVRLGDRKGGTAWISHAAMH